MPRGRRSAVLLAPVWAFAAWAGACSPAPTHSSKNEPLALAHEEHARIAEPGVTAEADEVPPVVMAATPAHEASTIGPTRYPAGLTQSPMTADVIAHLRAVVDAGAKLGNKRDVVIKVGDSHSVSPSFLECFTGRDYRLGAFDALEPARSFFHGFARESAAAKVGWHAVQTLGAPIREEVSVMHPAFAVLMVGTNDTRQTPPADFERYLAQNVDSLIAHGVVPIVSTIPPRGDGDAVERLVPEMNTIIRAVAQARQVPLVDLFSALDVLPDGGLAGDGIHLRVLGNHGCWLTDEGLAAGMNQRNLLTLAALDRMRRYVLGDEPAEVAPPQLHGDGTWEAPLRVNALPFADDRDTRAFEAKVDDYGGCVGAPTSGGEIVYELDLAADTRLRIRAFGDRGSAEGGPRPGDVDVDLFWLDGEAPDSCAQRADRALEITAPAGKHRLVVDTASALSGSFRLTIVPVEI
jgi:hypothetical protein